MKLSKICEEIEYTLLQGSLETEVRDIIYDSRKIAPETMFVCMVGAVTDGHKYIPDAIDKGASVIVLEREEEAAQIPENIECFPCFCHQRGKLFIGKSQIVFQCDRGSE